MLTGERNANVSRFVNHYQATWRGGGASQWIEWSFRSHYAAGRISRDLTTSFCWDSAEEVVQMALGG